MTLQRWLFPVVLPLALLAALLGHATLHWQLPMLATIERQIYDLRLRLSAPTEPDPRIVIVDIEERSLAALGRWPWKRSQLATLLGEMFDTQGALLVGVDMILAEPDDSSGLSTLDALARGPLQDDARFAAQLKTLRPQLDHDAQLAAMLQTHAVVLGFHGSSSAGAPASGELPAPLASAEQFGKQADALPHWKAYGANLPQLQQAAFGAGFLNVPTDEDGISRRVPLLGVIDGEIHASLPLVVLQALSNASTVMPARAGDGDEKATLTGLRLQAPGGELLIPTDAQGAVLVPYRTRSGAYRHYAAVDVLQRKLPPDALRGRIVLLGASAPGLSDQHTTPVGGDYPGPALHASVLSGLLDGHLARTPAYAPGLEAVQLLLVAAILLPLLPRLGLAGGLALGLGVAAVAIAVNTAAWLRADEAWPLAGTLVLVPALLGMRLLHAYFVERRNLRRLSALFGQYVPPERVHEMSLRPERYSMDSRSAELTVMFADVRGFTGLAERMPPDRLSALMHDFFTTMTEVVQTHGGTLDKYIGDALMAFWGAPVDSAQHARQAVDAALAMHRALQELNRRSVARGLPTLAISIGIHSGPMVVGDLGSRQRRAYTVLGDSVNLAARLQQLCSERGLDLLVSESTRWRVGLDLNCLDLGEVRLRGRAQPVRIYRIGAHPAATESLPATASS